MMCVFSFGIWYVIMEPKKTQGGNLMKTKVFCRTTGKGTQSFFLSQNGKEYFLFSQSYRRSVRDYFSVPISFDEAIDYSKAKRNSALLRTMEKIIPSTKYIEREYTICVRKQSNKRTLSKSHKVIA